MIRSARSDGLHGFRQGRGIGRIEREFDNAAVAGGDVGFAADKGAVVHLGDQGGVDRGGRVDAAARGENLGGQLDGLGKVAGDLSESGDKEVAEVVALQGIAGAEAMVEEAGEQCFFFAEGDHAVAQVAGGKHVEVLAQAAGGATVVGDGDHGGQVGDGARGPLRGLAGRQRHGGAGRAAAWRGRCRRRWRRRAWAGRARAASGPEEVSEGKLPFSEFAEFKTSLTESQDTAIR